MSENQKISRNLDVQNNNQPSQTMIQPSDAELYQAHQMHYMYWLYYMMSQQRHFQQLQTHQIKVQEANLETLIKKQEKDSSQNDADLDSKQNPTNKKTQIYNTDRIHKVKKRKKQSDRSTQKNLLVHLKLWLQRFIQEKAQAQPFLKRQFYSIFAVKSHKSLKEVYMNLALLSRVLQNQVLRPCLQQFFQKRILRYLISSNIQNKICLVKYVPILLKKYAQGKCLSLKS